VIVAIGIFMLARVGGVSAGAPPVFRDRRVLGRIGIGWIVLAVGFAPALAAVAG